MQHGVFANAETTDQVKSNLADSDVPFRSRVQKIVKQ